LLKAFRGKEYTKIGRRSYIKLAVSIKVCMVFKKKYRSIGGVSRLKSKRATHRKQNHIGN
jgi:hypothetical protein